MSLEGVSKTALLTLRARVEEHRRADGVFSDPKAEAWFEQAEWPAELDTWFDPRVASFLAFRAHEIDLFTREAVEDHGAKTIVELGCGLSTRRDRVAVDASWVDIDLEGVIALRERLGVSGGIACSVLDDAWMDAIEDPAPFLIAEGLLYYLPKADVLALFDRLRARFSGALIAFDVLGDMDFELARKRSTAVGTPMLWKVDRFSDAFRDFGVSIVEGWAPQQTMARAIDLYWPRFGRVTHLTMKALSKIGPLADMRSGVVAGRLT